MNAKLKRIVSKLASIPTDKLLHFIPTGRLWCVVPAIVAAFAKEVYDEIDYGGFDWVDLCYTVAGGMIIQVFAWI